MKTTTKTSAKKTNILALKGAQATKAFLANKDTEDFAKALKKIDEEYEPVHVFKAENFTVLDVDMPVTYTMFADVDDCVTMFTDYLSSGEIVIDDDTTLLDAIREFIESRSDELPVYETEDEYRTSRAYHPEDFFPALCDGAWEHTDEIEQLLDKSHVQSTDCCEANDGSRLDMWCDTVVDNNVKYNVTVYVPEEEYEKHPGCDKDGNLLDWEHYQVDVHFRGFVD